MSDIFISYSSEDRTKAKLIAETLNEHGWSVWWDRKIPAGKNFGEVIEAELTTAKCIIILWSQYSVNSDWVREEALEAQNRKVIIPVKIENVIIPFGFRRIQASNLYNWNNGHPDEEDFELLMNDVANFLESQNVKENVAVSSERIYEAPKIESEKTKKDNSVAFLTANQITETISELVATDEYVKSQLLIFKTKDQHTWLVATNKQLYCLLDDEETRKNKNLIMWYEPLKKARNNISAVQHKRYSGLIHINNHKNWLYSVSLFPTPDSLIEAVKKLLF